ncbi:MAG: hypothetical protein WAO02_00075 [Verrucomicrobiia bacterium]
MNFAPVDATSGHTESIFSVVFEILQMSQTKNVSISFRRMPADGCSAWLSAPDKTDTVGGVKRRALDHQHTVPQPRVPTGVD